MGVINQVKALAITSKKKDIEMSRVSKEKYSKIEDCPDPKLNFREWMKF